MMHNILSVETINQEEDSVILFILYSTESDDVYESTRKMQDDPYVNNVYQEIILQLKGESTNWENIICRNMSNVPT